MAVSSRPTSAEVSAIDLFCGAGGLSLGLRQAGIEIAAGVDNDPLCASPFEKNIEAPFIEKDVANVSADLLARTWRPGSVRLLAGCAPCQPFSPYRRGADTSSDSKWPLLDQFARLVRDAEPELVTMENVPRLRSTPVFTRFLKTLRDRSYFVTWKSCYGPDFGLPQSRRRLVLLASRLGPMDELKPSDAPQAGATVRSAIGALPELRAGESDPSDPLHAARRMSELNMQRIRSSSPGGSWLDWPEGLRAECHKRSSGASFRNVYARMAWDDPAPTITTLAHNFGAGRFGHPTQDRAISLREAAMLQGFPRDYVFTGPRDKVTFSNVGRMIGNAVPPPVARAAGHHLINHLSAMIRSDATEKIS